MKSSASAPNLPVIKQSMEQIYGKRWTTENKRYLHTRRERIWLAEKQKHQFIDFSFQERKQFRKYFDALAGSNGRIGVEGLENMLISLGLADNKKDVAALMSKIDDLKTGELDFEQFLELVKSRNESHIVKVFKDMLDGKLGDPNLNFQTVISEYRRQRILEAAGSHATTVHQQEHGSKVLANFAALQRSRYLEAHSIDEDAMAMGLVSPSAGQTNPSKEPNFMVTGQAPMGGMEMVWRGVCTEHNLVPSRPASADGRRRRTVEKPPSPRDVVAEILKGSTKTKKKLTGSRGTIIVEAPALEEEFGGRRGSKDLVGD